MHVLVDEQWGFQRSVSRASLATASVKAACNVGGIHMIQFSNMLATLNMGMESVSDWHSDLKKQSEISAVSRCPLCLHGRHKPIPSGLNIVETHSSFV